MKINYNLSAITANNALSKAEGKLQSSLAKLSSGYKINDAKDDPTGMAISRKMQQQLDALDKNDQSALNAVSLLETAESGISEIQAMLQRMRELNVQAANGTNTTSDKTAIQTEVDQLVEEIDRISSDTEYNGISLLNGYLQEKGFTSQPDSVSVDEFSSEVPTGDYTVSLTALATQGVAMTGDLSALASYTSTGIPDTLAGNVTLNGFTVSIEEGDTLDDIYEKLKQAGDYTNVNVLATTTSSTPSLTTDTLDSAGYTPVSISSSPSTTSLLFVSQDYGSDASVNVSCNNTALAAALGISSSSAYNSTTGAMTDAGTDTQLTLGANFKPSATYSSDGDQVTISDLNGFEIDLTVSPLSDTTTPVDLEITNMGDLSVQVGGKDGQNINVSIADSSAKSLGVDNLSMVGSEEITKSLDAIDGALDKVSDMLSNIGAYENRFDSTMTTIDETTENVTQSYSRIMDTDMASEMTEYTQQNVINQAATSMLAQANDLPQTVLQLLSR